MGKTRLEYTWNILDKILSRMRDRSVFSYLRTNAVVGDIGCGRNATLLRSIAPRIQRGYGYDIFLEDADSPENITLLHEKFPGKEYIQFDVLCLFAVLEHLPHMHDTNVLLKNIHDRLKPGGVFIMTTPDRRAQPLLEFLAFHLHIINEYEIRDHKHYFTKRELLDICHKAGFTWVEHRFFQFGLNHRVVCKK